ncbi:hypothetical protein OROGR_006796 [Orobanche gracilis]
MELKVSPEKPGFSSSDVGSDPEDKEISEGEDEDDDRNHKHRRRDAHSEYLDGDSPDQGLTRAYRKRNRPFDNGYSYREGDSQANETWRNHNSFSDRGFPSRFEKRRSNPTLFPEAPLYSHQRIRGGRGREPISWGIPDSRLGLLDISSQVVQPGHGPSVSYAGRGFASVSNMQSTSWNPFGLVPSILNGRLDSLHPLGLQGAFRPSITPPMNIGIPRQRCRDFEERGFCLRGDMCPMEHGVNRIVVDDVQSLSQFNLPVALPGSQLLGTSSAQGPLHINNKAFHAKINKPETTQDFGLNGGVFGGFLAGASDVYDPDQPLWTNDDPETSATLCALNQSTADGTNGLLDVELSNRQKFESAEEFNEELPLKNATTTTGSQSSSVWGRISGLKPSSEAKEKFGSVGTSSSYLEPEIKSEKALSKCVPDVPFQVKESFLKQHSNYSFRNIRKPSQKALRTLFVNGIPLKDNRREALLSHFQKFGEVIDIYSPTHSDRAFVQFSQMEEAEAALEAPDAVMGNRFIKLFWANRDNIPDDRISGGDSVPIIPRVPSLLDKGKENPHRASGKEGNAHAHVGQLPVHEHSKPMDGHGPKAPPPQQKKLERLELLKEELRKKQEMLELKRNEFRRQLDKLEEQAVGSKDGTTKRLKGETPPSHAKAETSKSSPRDNMKTDNITSTEHAMSHKSASNPTVPVQEEPIEPSFRPPLSGTPWAVNRFKLDNRPTAFRIVSPLPAGLANVAALEEHFSAYGELCSVELAESQQDTKDASVSSNVSARVSFTTRPFAEKAFLHGKLWQGHKLQFMWLKSVNSGKEGGGSGNLSAANKRQPDAKVQTFERNAPTYYQKTAPLVSDENDHLEIEAKIDIGEGEKDSKSSSTSSLNEKQPS